MREGRVSDRLQAGRKGDGFQGGAFFKGTAADPGQPAGQLLAVWQRVCYAGAELFQHKVAASVAVCRRGGSTAVFQCLNMPFEMRNCVVVGSQYWNVVFGMTEAECAQDAEGMQTMRTLAHNMAWALKNLRRDGAAAVAIL